LKRIWFGAGLLIALLILGIGSNMLMEHTQLAQAQRLNRAAALAAEGDWAAARSLSADARQQWEEEQFLIAALCSHEPMDRIDGLFAQLEVLSDARSAASFSSTCVYLACQLEALGRSHGFSFENFL